MSFVKRGALLGAVLVFLSMSSSLGFAQGNKVVAKVNGQEIRESDIAAAANDNLPQLTRIAPKQRLAFLVQFLVERYLIADAAEKAKTADSADFKNALAFYRRKALRDTFVRNSLAKQVTEKVMQDAYSKAIKGFSAKPEVRARHILVKTEKEAKAIAAQLKKGADFIKLAKAKSIGPSKVQGGDLGYFNKEKMVPSFSAAAFKLKKGDVSPPVKSDFGWHLIKVIDKRHIKIPPYTRMRARIRSRLIRDRVEQLAGQLRAKAKVEVFYEAAKAKHTRPAPDTKPSPKKK